MAESIYDIIRRLNGLARTAPGYIEQAEEYAQSHPPNPNNADDPARRTNIRNLYNLDRDIVNEMCQAIERMDKGTPQGQRTMGYLLEQLTEMRDRLRSAVIGLGAPPRYPGCPRPGAPVGRQEPDSNYVLGTLVKQQTEALRNPADVQSHVARSQSSGQGV